MTKLYIFRKKHKLSDDILYRFQKLINSRYGTIQFETTHTQVYSSRYENGSAVVYTSNCEISPTVVAQLLMCIL